MPNCMDRDTTVPQFTYCLVTVSYQQLDITMSHTLKILLRIDYFGHKSTRGEVGVSIDKSCKMVNNWDKWLNKGK